MTYFFRVNRKIRFFLFFLFAGKAAKNRHFCARKLFRRLFNRLSRAFFCRHFVAALALSVILSSPLNRFNPLYAVALVASGETAHITALPVRPLNPLKLLMPSFHSAAEIKRYLTAAAEPRHRDFQLKITPDAKNLLGVRTPKLRALANAVARDEAAAAALLARQDFSTFEETLLFGFVAGLRREPLAAVEKYIDIYVAHIDNWALCDGFCSSLKIARREPEAMLKIIRRYLRSARGYDLRFAAVMLLNYYLDAEHIDFVLDAYDKISHPDCAVKMAVAWGVATALPKFREKTLAFLPNNHLDQWTYRCAVQKIRESRRVPAADRELVKEIAVHHFS